MEPGHSHGQTDQNDLSKALFTHNADHIALKSTKAQLTYGQLSSNVQTLRKQLEGVFPEAYKMGKKCVVLHLPNSVANVELLLSLVEMECPFTSVAVDSPLARLEYIMADVDASVLITTRSVLDCGKLAEIQPLELCSMFETTVDEEVVVLQVQISRPVTLRANLSDECCYVMYTSGSTGNPKGVECGRSALINMARGQIERFRLSKDDVTAQFSAVGFDAIISEIFSALMSGGTLAVLYFNERTGLELRNTVQALGVTVITLSSTLLAVNKKSDFPTLKKIISAGEVCSKRIGNLWLEGGGLEVFNAYGTAETTVCSVVYEHTMAMSGNEDGAGGIRLPIGQALPNVSVSVRDSALKVLGPGEEGQICIAGRGLALGYIGQASELTKDRFVSDPANPGQRLYLTGDMGFFLDNGALVFKCRVDQQAKLRGYMVNLQGVEETILQCEGVVHAAVVIQQAGTTNDRLVAYVSPKEMSASVVEDFLRTRLDRHEVPTHIKMVDLQDLPRNDSGKIDKAALAAEPFSAVADELPSGGAVLTELQRQVAKVWCEVLETGEELIDRLTSETTLNDAGIESVRVGDVQKGLIKAFGVTIPSYEIQPYVSLEMLAEMVEAALPKST